MVDELQVDEILEEEEEDTQKDMYMTFKSGDEFFGISISNVNEIIPMSAITEVPDAEDYVKGLINLRGKIIPVIDVRVRFRQEALPYTDRTCIIVINVKDIVVGLIVEKIDEVIKIDKSNVIPPPSLNQNLSGSNKYVCGLAKAEDGVKLLLSPERLIQDEDFSAYYDEPSVDDEAEKG